MKNELLTKGIILPSGEIGKNKINLVAGAITQPFAEMVWVTTGGDMETINRLTDVLVTMNTPADREKLFKVVKLLYGLTPTPGEQERRYFYALMLRSRGRKSLDLCGFVGAFSTRQGIYTFFLKIAVLLRNI